MWLKKKHVIGFFKDSFFSFQQILSELCKVDNYVLLYGNTVPQVVKIGVIYLLLI